MTPPHPTDEDLSALLDGEAADATAAHAGSCPMCGARLAELEAVAAAVGAPVPSPTDENRDAAVATALAAVDDVGARRAHRERSVPRWLAPAAAAAVLVAVVIGVALAGGGGRSSNETAKSQARNQRTEAGAGSAGSGASAAQDLGPLDEASLRRAVATNLSPDAQPGPAAPIAGGLRAGATAANDVAACERVLRAQAPALPALVLAASATWDGQRAAVLVFRAGDEPAQVYVTSQAGCRILHFERFQPSS